MPNVLSFRAKMAVLAPSTNTVVEPEFYAMAPEGVTFHIGRIYNPNPVLTSDAEFERTSEQIRRNLDEALLSVLTCRPDYLVMGMSSETFHEGREGNRHLTERMEAASGLKVTTGAAACYAALERLGLRRIAVLTPYQPVGDAEVAQFFTDWGCEVVRTKGLRCADSAVIADVDEATMRRSLVELNGPDVEALVQVGTNLPMARLADEAERWLGKPVLAINAVTLWHALRACGIRDKIRGFGCLLRDH